MRKRPHFRLTYVAQSRLPYWPIIDHFRVPKSLTFKMRPSAQPFLWKWVLFAWEWKIFSISKPEHLTSFWYRGPGELGIGLLVNYYSLSLIKVPEAFTKVSSAQFLLVSKSREFINVTKKTKTSNLVTLKILSKRTQRRTLIPIGRWFIASTMANSSKLLITTWEERINTKQIKNQHKLCSLCLRAKKAHGE